MKIALAVGAAVAVLLIGALGYMGVFTPLKVAEESMGPYPFVYAQEASTDFKKVGEITEALGTQLEQAGYANRKPAQVFYPVGRGIQNQIGFVTDRAVTREVLGADLYFRPVPVQNCMVTRFPFRNPMSFMVGAWRVNGALAKHREAKKYQETSVMVILEGDSITYLQPIAPG